MNTEDLKTRLRAELPALLQQDAGFRQWLEQVIRATAVTPEGFDARFERMLAEFAADRAEQRRKWDENAYKWDEQAEQLADNQRRLDEQAQERAQKWADNQRRLDEQAREQAQKWADNQRRLDEQAREQAQQWADNQRRLDEQAQEQAQKWADNQRRWDEQAREQAQQWADNQRRWEAHTREQAEKWADNQRRWDEQAQRWEEQSRINQELLQAIKAEQSRRDQGIGALGARWGLASEQSFRAALKGILEVSFGVQVLNINEFDDEGLVFGVPDQVEIDIIIHNGELILCELKASMSRSDMYTFGRKIDYYQRRHGRTPTRRIVISPMVQPAALRVAEGLGIEVFSYAEDATRLGASPA